MKIIWSFLVLFFLGLLILSCEEKKEIVGTQIPFAIQEFSIPEIMSTLSDRPILVTAKVTHPDGSSGIDRVVILLPDSLGQSTDTLSLYDEGGTQQSNSGDAVAFDQVFSRLIVPGKLWDDSLQASFSVSIRAFAKSGDFLESAGKELELLPNQPPEVLDFSIPDSIPADFQPFDISVTVNDNDGLDDVRWVILHGDAITTTLPSFNDTLFNPQTNSPIFTKEIDSSFAVGKFGEYELSIFAEDRVQETSEDLMHTIFIENRPPVIDSVSIPDTLIVPQSGQVNAVLTTKVEDKQGLADIDSVYFNSFLPNDSAATNNPFEMFDDGSNTSGDEVAGDGIYTLTIRLLPGTPTGEYEFHFFARDRARQLTTGPVKLVQIVQ